MSVEVTSILSLLLPNAVLSLQVTLWYAGNYIIRQRQFIEKVIVLSSCNIPEGYFMCVYMCCLGRRPIDFY